MSAIFLRPAVRRILPKLVILLIVVYLGVGFFSSSISGTGKVGGIKNGGELAQKITTGAPVFVAFSASWCMPCKMMAPEIEHVAAKNKKVEFLKIDIDEHRDVAEKHQVGSVPAVFLFNRGAEVGKFMGSHDRNFIQGFLDEKLQQQQ